MNKLIKKISIAITICLSLSLCIVPTFADDSKITLTSLEVYEYESSSWDDGKSISMTNGSYYLYPGKAYTINLIFKVDSFENFLINSDKYGLESLRNIDGIIPLGSAGGPVDEDELLYGTNIAFQVSKTLTENKQFSVEVYPDVTINFTLVYDIDSLNNNSSDENNSSSNNTSNNTTNKTETSAKVAPNTSVR